MVTAVLETEPSPKFSQHPYFTFMAALVFAASSFKPTATAMFMGTRKALLLQLVRQRF
jgi:hypothetical protein